MSRSVLLSFAFLLCAGTVRSQGETVCNMPETGTLLSGGRKTIRLAASSSIYDNYYVGSRITITGGTGAGSSSVITAYCGAVHTSCSGLDSSGTLTSVSWAMSSVDNVVVASTLKLRLPAIDGGGRSVPNDGTTTCSDRLTSPYMTSYSVDCAGEYKGLNIYITKGTGAGQVGLIRAGPDSNRDVLVTGLFGWCAGGDDTLCDQSGADQATCVPNHAAQCITDADCTGGGTCQAPVDSGSSFNVGSAPASSICNPMCNNVASYTATVDFATTTDGTSTYTLQKGCYDERYAGGMRRLGASGSGAGQQNVHLDWKVLIPNGGVVGRPVIANDESVIVATDRGTLTKINQEGAKFWSVYVGSVVGNLGIGHDGTIYFGSGDRNIWAVTDNGITKWRYTTPMPVHSSPLVTEDAVYIGDRNGTFYKFNLDGSVAWKFYTQGEIWGGAAMTRDKKVIFGSMDTFLYCLNSTTGAVHWFTTAQQEIVGTPLIQDTSIVFGTRESEEEYGQIIALRMDGTLRWQYPVTSSIESEPVEGPYGEVFVSTVDGKIFAIQADGQLLWKYNTGGTGGVCRQQTYSTEERFIANGGSDTNTTDGSSITLQSTANSADGYYQGYRATIKVGSGYLSTGQFVAVPTTSIQYVADVGEHDTYFNDTSNQDTAVAIQFTVQDRMIAGEKISLSLPGLFQASIASVTVYPQDLSTSCTGNTRCAPAGQSEFGGVSGTASAGTVTSITLASGADCAHDDGCAGATISFTSGSGVGQTSTIVRYVHSTRVATFIEVGTAPDATTSYSIAPAIVSKFGGAWSYTAPTGVLELTVSSTTGTASCASGCTSTYMKLANTESAAAGALDNYVIEFVSGTGAGQTTRCLKYYGSASNGCDIDLVTLAPDATTVYRVGPLVEMGERISLVLAFGQFAYPDYSGTLPGAQLVNRVTLAATAAPLDNFYAGMTVELRYGVTPKLARDITGLEEFEIDIDTDAATAKIGAGAYIKVDDEAMLVLSTAASVWNGSSVSTLTVRRAQLETLAALHTNTTSVEVFEYASIASYAGATQEATLSENFSFDPAGGVYRIIGTSSSFELERVDQTVFSSVPTGFEGLAVPSEYQTTTVVLGGEVGTRYDGFFTGATLVIKSGPGAGLRTEILGFNATSGTATVAFNLQCGMGDFCAPKGEADSGYGSLSGYPTSAYDIEVVGTVISYTSSYVATLSGVSSAIPSTINVCGSPESESSRFCSSYSTSDTPVALEWSSGSWCGTAGGTGWGATSPCLSGDLLVTTSSNKFVYGIGIDGIVRFKYMTGKRIRSPPRCVTNADRTVTIYTGSNDHFVYRLTSDPQKVLRGGSWYNQ